MAETQNYGESPKPRADYLPEALGFHETPDMAALRREATAAMAARGSRGVELSVEYLSQAEAFVVRQAGSDRDRATVGLNIVRALMYRDAGRHEDYLEAMNDVLYDLDNLVAAGFEEWLDTIEALERVVDDEVAKKQQSE